MMKKFTFLFILLCGFIANQSYAQFTGKIQFNSYEVENGQKQMDDESATVYITPERIFIQPSGDVDLGGSMNADGVLIRNDKEDVIILQGDNKALKLSKASIISFMSMAAGFAKSADTNNGDDDEDNFSFKKTGKTKTINGYSCDQFIITESDEPNQHTVLWMTESLDINWGFLKDIAAQAQKSFGKKGAIASKTVFKSGYFPIAGKDYENNKVTKTFEVNVTPTNEAKSHVNLPAGVQVMDMQQYMMQMMQKMQNDSSN